MGVAPLGLTLCEIASSGTVRYLASSFKTPPLSFNASHTLLLKHLPAKKECMEIFRRTLELFHTYFLLKIG